MRRIWRARSAALVRLGGHQTPLDRRSLLVSASGHLILLFAFAAAPILQPREILPSVLEVTLMARPNAVQQSKEAKLPPVSVNPPELKPKKVLIPKKSIKFPKPKPESPPTPIEEPSPEIDLADVLAEFRREERAPTQTQSRSGGAGVQMTAKEAAWRRRVKLHVTRNWVLAPGFRRQLLRTEIQVRLGGNGAVQSISIIRRSGNPWFDESVERAIQKSSPLPTPERPGKWAFVFSPEDQY